MSAAFVVDCSVALTWLFDEESTAATQALLDRLRSETVVVPTLWYLEVSNIVALAERKGRISQMRSAAFLAELSTLDIESDSEGAVNAFSGVLPLCRQHNLTSYDALYLKLTLRRNLPLASLDMDLRKVATQLGVQLLGL